MKTTIPVPYPLTLALGLIACGGSAPPPASPAVPPATFAEQVTLGQELYGSQCAGCHGASGEGGDAPPLVGLAQGALPLDPPQGSKYRTTQFKTVADIAAFTTKNMPPRRSDTLSDVQHWAILAFDLKANGIELQQPLDAAVAATLEIPR
jgi:mono/diheme cytochrome c family protein